MLQKKIITLFITLLCFLLLCSCAKKEPSSAISQATQKEISTIQKDIQKSTCDNKDILITRLDNIKAEINNITLACKTEKEVLKQENSKLKIIIVSLILILLASGYIIIKKRV